MSSALRCWVCLSVMLCVQVAVRGESFEEQWKALRQKQPPGLTLQMKLPQKSFVQGEIISATLIFENLSTNRYQLWTGTYDRSGRITDIAFAAQSEAGQAVVDPLAAYFASYSGMGGGLGNEQDLGRWSITLPANQWLRFDRPGTYRLYARSTRPRLVGAEASGASRAVEVVSDIVTIQIRPLAPERERQLIAQAQAELSQGAEKARGAMETLRYLQTPAARGALLAMLSKEYPAEAVLGLVAAPDPNAEATAVLQAATQPDVAVTPTVLWLYGVLRTLGQLPNSERAQGNQVREQAGREITAGVRAALPAKHGAVLVTTVLTLLSDSPRDQELRALLVANQRQLARHQLRLIIQQWEKFGGDDFLAMIRAAARPLQADPEALGLLARIAPNEARPLILEDLARAKPLYIDPHQGRYAVKPLEALPDKEWPEMDEVLRKKLRDKNCDLFTVMPLVARYATTNLLADVLAVYKRSEGAWACDVQNSALRYWIRCNPKEGVQALARALKARQKTGCYRSTLAEVLLPQWTDEAQPLVLAALQDRDAEVIESAVKVLEQHGGSDVIPQIILAIQRCGQAASRDGQQAWRAESMARVLLNSQRWTLTRAQREQLAEALPNGSAKESLRQGLK